MGSMDSSDNTDNACAGLTDAERARLAEAAGILLDARGIVIRASEWLGGRLRGIGSRYAAIGPDLLGRHLLGESAQARYQALVEAALRHAYRVGTLGLDTVSARPPRRRAGRLVAAATGGASGLIGAPAIAADLPVTTCLMMRSIAEIARAHGEDLTSADTRQACIEVFAFGGPEIADEDIDIAWWTIRGSLSHASIALLIRQIAARFGAMLSQKYLAQAVPLIGAAAGSTLNYVFMDYYQRMARVHFTLRELERRHDPDAVRACFDGLLRAARSRRAEQRKRPPTRLLRADAPMLDHAPSGDGGQGWTGARSRARSMPAT
jgi:EcsC protein family